MICSECAVVGLTECPYTGPLSEYANYCDLNKEGRASSIVKGMVSIYESDYEKLYGKDKKDSKQWCSHHFRDPFPVDTTHFVYLSSSRKHDEELKKEGHTTVDFGVYLDQGWKWKLQPGTKSSHVNLPDDVNMSESFLDKWESGYNEPLQGVYLPWQDRGVPTLDRCMMLLEWINPLIDAGKRIEIACMGGHGRTGTLTAMIMLSRNAKLNAADAIKLVRTAYCDEAIESYTQEKAIYEIAGEEAPPPPPAKTFTPKNDKAVTVNQLYPFFAKDAEEIRRLNIVEPWSRLALDFTDVTEREELSIGG